MISNHYNADSPRFWADGAPAAAATASNKDTQALPAAVLLTNKCVCVQLEHVIVQGTRNTRTGYKYHTLL